MQSLRPCSRPTQPAPATYHYAQCSVCQVERLSPSQSLELLSTLVEMVGSISTLSLCKPHFQRHLILISHNAAYENSLPRELIPISNSFISVSHIELTFAILQFPLLPLGLQEKHQDLFLRAESSGWKRDG